MRKDLTLREITYTNLERCKRWHGEDGIFSWDVNKWAVAMAGEAGEICNAVKKLNRIEDEFASVNEPDRNPETREDAIRAIGEEIADTLHYLTMLAARLDIDITDVVIEKFNNVSIRYGFPERL